MNEGYEALQRGGITEYKYEFNESIAILHKPAQDGCFETAEIQKLGRSVPYNQPQKGKDACFTAGERAIGGAPLFSASGLLLRCNEPLHFFFLFDVSRERIIIYHLLGEHPKSPEDLLFDYFEILYFDKYHLPLSILEQLHFYKRATKTLYSDILIPHLKAAP